MEFIEKRIIIFLLPSLRVVFHMLPLQRDCGRPPVPRKDPGDKPVEEPLLSNHPYVDKVCFYKESFSDIFSRSNVLKRFAINA